MAKLAAVKVKEGKTEEAIIGLLKSLIEKGVVQDIIVPKALPSGEGFVQTLIRNAELLAGASALAPTMPVQSARVISNLSVKNLGKKVAAVLKLVRIHPAKGEIWVQGSPPLLSLLIRISKSQ